MKIQSQFVDYYDHVAHQYGGGDPSCLYLRKRLVDRVGKDGESYGGLVIISQNGIVRLPYINNVNLNFRYKWLSVCAKYYLLIQTFGENRSPSPWKIIDKALHAEAWKSLTGRWNHSPEVLKCVGVFSESLLEISRKVNAPVFTFDTVFSSYEIHVDGEIPILGDIGLPSKINSQQLYQDIAYFLGNIMKLSPDMMPATSMTDKEKVLQHGFDKKVSFRHRM